MSALVFYQAAGPGFWKASSDQQQTPDGAKEKLPSGDMGDDSTPTPSMLMLGHRWFILVSERKRVCVCVTSGGQDGIFQLLGRRK